MGTSHCRLQSVWGSCRTQRGAPLRPQALLQQRFADFWNHPSGGTHCVFAPISPSRLRPRRINSPTLFVVPFS
jgi:hypothetical protein